MVKLKKEAVNKSKTRLHESNAKRRLRVKKAGLKTTEKSKERAIMSIKRKTLNVSVEIWEKLQVLQEFEKSKSLNDIVEKIVNDRLENDKLTNYFEFIYNVREATEDENEEIVNAIQEMTADDLKTAKKFDI